MKQENSFMLQQLKETWKPRGDTIPNLLKSAKEVACVHAGIQRQNIQRTSGQVSQRMNNARFSSGFIAHLNEDMQTIAMAVLARDR